ncbi:hypothetical protein ACFL1H_04490 [Nanoarchaeota archaeon]
MGLGIEFGELEVKGRREFWKYIDRIGMHNKHREEMYNTLDKMSVIPSNIAYLVNLIYCNNYADFKGISADGFPPLEVMNDPVQYYLDHHEEDKINFQIEPFKAMDDYDIYKVSWKTLLRSGWKENDNVTCYFYVPDCAERITYVVNGYREPNWMFQKKMTKRLLNKSAVLYFPLPFHMERCPEIALNGALMINYAMPRNVGFAQLPVDLITAINHLSDPNINYTMNEESMQKSAYIGTSLGAIMGLWAYLKILEHNKNQGENIIEFESFIPIIGGVDVPGIIKESEIFKMFHHLINEKNMALIHGYDPANVIDKVDLPLRNVFPVIARYDTIVPTIYGEKMVKMCGIRESSVLWFRCGHSSIFVEHEEISKFVNGVINADKRARFFNQYL